MSRSSPQPSQIPVPKRRSSGLSFALGPPAQMLVEQISEFEAVQSPLQDEGDVLIESSIADKRSDAVSPGGDEDSRSATPQDTDLQHQVNSLKMSLMASEQRCRDLMSSVASNPSDPATPLGPPFSDKQLPALPHSDASFDLRRRAVETPAAKSERRQSKDGKLGLSRIPVSTVTHAASFHPTPPSDVRTRRLSSQSKPKTSSRSNSPLPTSPTPYDSPSPGFRQQEGFLPRLDVGSNLSLTPPSFRRSESPANGRRAHASPSSTTVIDSLHTDLVRSKDHIERLKADLRLSARTVATLTRQCEDLKDTRERNRVESEGLNNMISRKERLLQEVLERARAAESELQLQLSTRKTYEKSTQKQIQTMITQLADTQVLAKKAETECSSMRDGMRGLRDQWAREVKALREEMKAGTERNRKERQEARSKHLALVQMVQSQSAERTKVLALTQDASAQSEAIRVRYDEELRLLRKGIEVEAKESREATAIASELATELARIRRLMREPDRDDLTLAATKVGI